MSHNDLCLIELIRDDQSLGGRSDQNAASHDITARCGKAGGLPVWRCKTASPSVSWLEYQRIWCVHLFTSPREPKSIIFHKGLFLLLLGDLCGLLLESFSQEVSLRQLILQEVAHTKDPDLRLVYLSCWLHQPFTSPQTRLNLEALLLETGHRPL